MGTSIHRWAITLIFPLAYCSATSPSPGKSGVLAPYHSAYLLTPSRVASVSMRIRRIDAQNGTHVAELNRFVFFAKQIFLAGISQVPSGINSSWIALAQKNNSGLPNLKSQGYLPGGSHAHP
jgi:hypothetical protein